MCAYTQIYCCGKKGHVSPECDKRNTDPPDEWHVRNGPHPSKAQGFQGEDESDETSIGMASASGAAVRRARRSG